MDNAAADKEILDSGSIKELPLYLTKLNDQQLKGALHFQGPILILAGAGSGKTRVLTHRIVHLVDYYKVPPWSILAVTFTNKAAHEMKSRISEVLGDRGSKVWASTFHSLGLKILRRHAQHINYSSDFVVYDQQDSKSLLKEIIKELKIDENRFPLALFLKAIDSAKNKCLTPEKFSERCSNYTDSIVGEVYDHFQRKLLKNNAMDFGDLLFNTYLLFKAAPEVLEGYQRDLQFILVDEFQDTNDIQYALIRMLAAPQNNLFAVGDDDQSIYAFRGATIENILNFEKDFPEAKVVALEQNYRSTQNILDSANAIISKNKHRRSKSLWTEQEGGSLISGHVAYDENEEGAFIAETIKKLVNKSGRKYSDIALFYRTNAQSRALEDSLMANSIPYRIYGGLKFYDRKEVKDILAYLKLVLNESDDQAFLRIINTPTRGIGPKAVDDIRELAKSRNCSMLQAAFIAAQESGPKALKNFIAMIEQLKKRASIEPLYQLIADTVEITGYGPKLKTLKDDVTAQSRLENLKELEAIAATMTSISDSPLGDLRMFLDRVSLTSSEELPVEETVDGYVKTDTVSLMTLHLAKGLEFPVVFLSGFEEGLLPHYRSLESEFELSEERRLCYVGLTRAMEKLYISRAERRGMFSAGGGGGGFGSYREPSRFLFDIPPSCLEEDGQEVLSGAGKDLHFEYTEELTYEDVLELKANKAATKNIKKEKIGSAKISAADYLGSKHNNTKSFKKADTLKGQKTHNYPLATIEDLFEGTSVFHPTFGQGKVVGVTMTNPEDPESSRISVDFNNSVKKLVFRYAKLGLL